MIFKKVLKKYITQFYQLKVGHGVMEIYLVRIRVIKTFNY